MKNISASLFVLLLHSTLFACNEQNSTKEPEVNVETLSDQNFDQYATAYFASGCFWCVEAVFESVKGVKEAVSGYSGGNEKNPTYEAVSRGQTSHAEAVKVFYDPLVVDFETLVKVFFASQDPTTPNQQGPDRGTQYRSIAFYQNEEEKLIIENVIEQLTKANVYSKPIVTEVLIYEKFWEAEEYHQNYEQRNPDNPYVRNVSIPRLNRFKEKMPEVLK